MQRQFSPMIASQLLVLWQRYCKQRNKSLWREELLRLGRAGMKKGGQEDEEAAACSRCETKSLQDHTNKSRP
eukprot:3343520-Rhodomonas_salina.5